MTSFKTLRFVPGNRVEAAGIALQRLPLSVDGEEQPVGEIDGVIIDLPARRVSHLVVKANATGRQCLVPLDGTCLDPSSRGLARIGGENESLGESFDASNVGSFDDDAVVSLLFGKTAA